MTATNLGTDAAPETTDHGPRRRTFRLALRVGWGVADQGISSLSNLLMGVLVARAVSPEAFGGYAVVYTTFAFVLSANRGPSTDPLLVRHSGERTAQWREAIAAATGCALGIGIATGALCVGIGLLLPANLSAGFIALGIGLPGILLQDSWRFGFFSCGRPQLAFLADLLWGVLQAGALIAILATHHLTVFTAVLAFGLTAGAAGVGAAVVGGIAPNPSRIPSWLAQTRSLGARYLVENLSIGLSRQLRITLVGVIAGLAAVGAIRGAEILAGPLTMLAAGVSQVAVPEAKEVLERAPHRLERFCFALGVPQVGLAAAWGAVAFVLVPRGLGTFLLGDNWAPASHLLLPMLMVTVLTVFGSSAMAGVRALGAAPRSLAAQVSNAAVTLVCSVAGAVLGGALGSYWGLTLGTGLGVILWWRQLRFAIRDHLGASS